MKTRLYNLDTMRGIAAITVVLFHVAAVFHLHFRPQSFLAVDFFFALSGFVLTRTYEKELKTLLSAWRFIEKRIIRLYPLIALGVAFGAVMMVGRMLAYGSSEMSPKATVIAFLCNLLTLPALNTYPPYALFPFDLPAWSLFFELVINVLFAWLLIRLSSSLLSVICVLAACVCLYGIHLSGNANIGAWWPSAIFGLARVSFSFPLGVLVARAYRAKIKSSSTLSLVILGVFTVVLLVVLPGRMAGIYDSIAIVAILPMLLLFGVIYELPKNLERVGALLGDVSYPLYAIHYPLLQIFAFVFIRRMHLAPIPMAIVFVVGVFVFSLAVARYFDVPVRKWLSARSNLSMSARPVMLGGR